MKSAPDLCLLLALLSLPAAGQRPGAWQDRSPHAVEFARGEAGVRLEVLDWGGAGRPVVLLSGSGNSAHVFDDFAPKLREAGCCRVYGITRRGFGASTHPESGHDDQQLADDVVQVIDSLKIRAPVLAGHSLAGAELTTVGNQHSDRIAGLIYLDALGDPTDFPADDGLPGTVPEFCRPRCERRQSHPHPSSPARSADIEPGRSARGKRFSRVRIAKWLRDQCRRN
jgi:pimeloyl-ACP methyl ester carboxylesterase